MNITESILFFIFVFSILTVLRAVVKFLSSLLSTPPQKLVLGTWELIFLGLNISFILTYIIKL
jgi:hypothetical protein